MFNFSTTCESRPRESNKLSDLRYGPKEGEVGKPLIGNHTREEGVVCSCSDLCWRSGQQIPFDGEMFFQDLAHSIQNRNLGAVLPEGFDLPLG